MTFTRSLALVTLAVALILPGGTALRAQQMPDPSQMSGVPLPVGDVEPGTVTVRVIRGSFANPVPSLTVEIAGASAPMRAMTNEAGRAEFTGLPIGARLKASATVAGERLESQEFAVPASGGIRLMLVAPEPDAGAAAGRPSAPPAAGTGRPGSVALTDESRFVFEMGEEGLSVFYILQFLNPTGVPVEPEQPLVFPLPAAARSATILEGSSPQASVGGGEMRIAGPLPPGPSVVQLAYSMPFSGAELVIEQRLPVTLPHLAVVAQKVGDMQLASPQMAEQRTMPAQGNLYIAGRGGPVQAGETLRFQFSNMPHHPTWPRDLALALAVMIMAGGGWAAFRLGGARREQATEWRQLEARRDHLFEELTALELRHRDGSLDPARYAERRRELISALEEVYVALDDEVALDRAS